MDVTGTINAGMTKMARSMRNSVDNCKADGKIAEQRKIIKALTREIGNLALLRLEAGDEMSPEPRCMNDDRSRGEDSRHCPIPHRLP